MNQDQEQRILESVLELEARRQADAKELLCKWWNKDDVPFLFPLSSLAITITVTVYVEKSTVVSYRNDAYHSAFTIGNVRLVLTIDKVHLVLTIDNVHPVLTIDDVHPVLRLDSTTSSFVLL